MIVAATCCIFGAALMAHGVRFWRKGRASLGWPTTTGRMSNAVVRRDDNHDVTVYRASARYTYSVDGTDYQGSTAFFGDRFWVPLPGDLGGRVFVLNATDDLAVHYNPERPRESVLQPGVHWHAFGAGAAGLAFLVWGVVALLT